MIFDLAEPTEVIRIKAKIQILQGKNAKVDLIEKRNIRTTSQNSSIHKYCDMIAEVLNDLGTTFTFTGLKGMPIDLRYTQNLVKETIWRPIQFALFDIESTTDISTKQVKEIALTIEKFLAEKGINLPFPNKETKEENESQAKEV